MALSIGLAFCTRKMCFDDRTKRNFTNIVWMHIQRSYSHLEKDNFPKIIRESSSMVSIAEVKKISEFNISREISLYGFLIY